MCGSECEGGAYLSVSVFIYRSLLVIISMISSSITRLKSTYLPITVIEELLLQLIYFIPLFTSSTFVFIGVQSDSFTFVVNGSVVLLFTLILRYGSEFVYIYSFNWDSLRAKLPSLVLNLTLDLILILILFLYADNYLRKLKGLRSVGGGGFKVTHSAAATAEERRVRAKADEEEFKEEREVDLFFEQKPKPRKEEPLNRPLLLRENYRDRKSPSAGPFRLPSDELDDISLPPSIPLASY